MPKANYDEGTYLNGIFKIVDSGDRWILYIKKKNTAKWVRITSAADARILGQYVDSYVMKRSNDPRIW